MAASSADVAAQLSHDSIMPDPSQRTQLKGNGVPDRV